MTNLASLLETTASTYPDRIAIVVGERRMTYRQLDEAANQVANLLVSCGVVPGDKVALTCPNIPEFTSIYFGILKSGAVVVPLNFLLKRREFAYHLQDSDAKVLFAFEGSAEVPTGREARDGFSEAEGCTHFFRISAGRGPGSSPHQADDFASAVERQPRSFETAVVSDDDSAVILYTSGTTGRPKGAELRHSSVRINSLAARDLYLANEETPDTYLCVLPLFHSFGQTAVQNASIAFGGTVVLMSRFEPRRVLDVMVEERITVFGGVPTMYWALLAALDDTVDVRAIAERLRVAISGGSALAGEIHREFSDRLGVTIIEGYGLSETSPGAAFSPWGTKPRVGSIGKPIPDVDMKLIQDDWSDVPDDPQAIGEIAIRGYNVMKGYYKRPVETAEVMRDGWFRSGDLGRKDEDGYFYIVDRSKDMIIRGGYNVYPREVEEVLMEHPAVSLVAVIGVPHPSHGEEIKAVVVKNAGDATSESDLIEWSRTLLAAYKYPRIIEFRDALPMTSTGKILKREL
ncbi:long-chain-fatty-acid--CoA ligase [Acrocarpospora pleiomorpha]|uniref:Long-chain-fatty-acid--CoA ligase n=1 Tax=Acrocarpospora pleiomorpha TaxID=90975 RepID=A0A5M3XE35_9ACTN|nr:long-chain fatty acid--CoA ligase [Acrocarpospora pleiomorpha]GES17183.1 long-chain-fatty-acid--CoA ligase [Acrocarpospora pleiomorpha]